MIKLEPVQAVDLIWPMVAEGMAVACQKGGGQYTAGWLWSLCRRSEAFLVTDIRKGKVFAAVVVQEQNWSGARVLNILAACGSDSIEWIGDLKGFAEEIFDFDHIVFEGREGWQRLPGVSVVRLVYRMEKSHGR